MDTTDPPGFVSINFPSLLWWISRGRIEGLQWRKECNSRTASPQARCRTYNLRNLNRCGIGEYSKTAEDNNGLPRISILVRMAVWTAWRIVRIRNMTVLTLRSAEPFELKPFEFSDRVTPTMPRATEIIIVTRKRRLLRIKLLKGPLGGWLSDIEMLREAG